MGKSVLFEYVIISHPNTKEEEGKVSEIISGDRILAKDMDQAKILISRLIPDKYISKLDDIEIAIRPF